MKLSLEHFDLVMYDSKHPLSPEIMEEIKKSNVRGFVKQIDERLRTNRPTSDFSFQRAYIPMLDDEVIGYLYVSEKRQGNCYLEYLLLPKMQHQGLGMLLLDDVSDYLFSRYPDLYEIRLHIDPSNVRSIELAERCDFFMEGMNQGLIYIKDNPYIKKEEYGKRGSHV